MLHLLVGTGLVGAGQVRAQAELHTLESVLTDIYAAFQTLNISMYNAIGKKGVYYGKDDACVSTLDAHVFVI